MFGIQIVVQERMLTEYRTGPVINQLDSPTYILVSLGIPHRVLRRGER